MADITAKENWLRAINGETPVHLPQYTLGWKGRFGYDGIRGVTPNPFNEQHHGPQGGKDVWGISYVANEETGYASLPEPNNFLLHDIDDWEKVVIAPKIPDIDWEAKAKADYEASDIDRSQSAVMVSGGFSPFMMLVGFMGFNDGLMALAEDPDACSDMLNYMADVYVPLIEKYIEYYKPDMLSLGDDICSKYNPFFGRSTFENVFLPVYKRLCKPATDRGVPVHWHICGRCEDYIPDLYDIGIRSTDPMQENNDINALKKRLNNKMLLCGGFDWVAPDNWPNCTEEEIKQMVRDHIDKYAGDGGFGFAGAALGRYGDETVPKVNAWIDEEVFAYGRNYYEKHK